MTQCNDCAIALRVGFHFQANKCWSQRPEMSQNNFSKFNLNISFASSARLSGGRRLSENNLVVQDYNRRYVKDGGRNFLPKCIAFFNRIPMELFKFRNSNAVHLVIRTQCKEFLAASLPQSSIKTLFDNPIRQSKSMI